MKDFLARTMITGIVLLIPVFFLGFVLVRVFSTLKTVIVPLVDKLEIETILGVILLNLLAVFALLVLIFGMGLLAYVGSIASRLEGLDNFLKDRVPGYAIVKGILSGRIQADTSVNDLKVVIAKNGDTARIGFEVEKIDSHNVMVFLPDVPNPQTGIAAAYHPENVQRIDMPPHQALEMLSFFGRGVGEEVGKIQKDRAAAKSS